MRRVILISAKQGGGKTTLANDLKMILQTELLEPRLVKFAEPIYEIHDTVYSMLKKYGIDSKGIDGTFMQFIGQHVRDRFGDTTWSNIAHHLVVSALQLPRAVVVCDDLRYQNELNVWDRNDTCLIRLECPEYVRKARAEKWREDTNHPSETELDGYPHWDMVFDTRHDRVPFYFAKQVIKWLKRT